MLRLARTLFVLGIIVAATLVMSPWRFGDRSIQSHMTNIVEKTGTDAIVQKSQSTFENYSDRMRQRIPEAFNDARRKIAMWINPGPPASSEKQD